MLKPLTLWIATNCGKFLKRWEYQTTLPASCETCMQVKKQELEPDMEQWTSSKLGKEYIKTVYCHPVYLTYMPMKFKLESRFLGETYVCIYIYIFFSYPFPLWSVIGHWICSLCYRVQSIFLLVPTTKKLCDLFTIPPASSPDLLSSSFMQEGINQYTVVFRHHTRFFKVFEPGYVVWRLGPGILLPSFHPPDTSPPALPRLS